MKNSRKIIGIFLILLLLYAVSLPQVRAVYDVPDNMVLFENEYMPINAGALFSVSSGGAAVRTKSVHYKYNALQPVFLQSVQCGTVPLSFKLLGLIPVRTVMVDVVPSVEVAAGGDSIGIIMQGDGATVVGSSPVIDLDNNEVYPAKEAGIKHGDVILAINDEKVESDAAAAEKIDSLGLSGQMAQLTIKRDEEMLTINVKPVYCMDSQKFRIGVFLKDKTMGIGTLTFVEPKSGKYGALGHQIMPFYGKERAAKWHGSIVRASVNGVRQGQSGRPGEKVGSFAQGKDILGNIEKNSPLGIYGHMEAVEKREIFPAASRSQLEVGCAQLLTVVDGHKIERFAVEIEKVSRQSSPEGKGFVIKVIDERLLAKTGGIVQGMSGSPIIQNGRIVGALTHVFLDDSTRGYGCFLEWMLEENHILPINKEKNLPFLFG